MLHPLLYMVYGIPLGNAQMNTQMNDMFHLDFCLVVVYSKAQFNIIFGKKLTTEIFILLIITSEQQ